VTHLAALSDIPDHACALAEQAGCTNTGGVLDEIWDHLDATFNSKGAIH
jgi:hypothetical protein